MTSPILVPFYVQWDGKHRVVHVEWTPGLATQILATTDILVRIRALEAEMRQHYHLISGDQTSAGIAPGLQPVADAARADTEAELRAEVERLKAELAAANERADAMQGLMREAMIEKSEAQGNAQTAVEMHRKVVQELDALVKERDAARAEADAMKADAEQAIIAERNKTDKAEREADALAELLRECRDAFLRAGTCKDDPICTDTSHPAFCASLSSACWICHEQVKRIDAALAQHSAGGGDGGRRGRRARGGGGAAEGAE